ncbi:MAG TPA: thrombospondin type 3 repeat-containing protein, partial [Gemmatimonadales bacterium]|nr:thrombospondin type 3 repeat-containing protein [Gemmatimonadales bacterium]
MRTYRFPAGGVARALRLLGVLVLTLSWHANVEAQERRYLFELGAAGAYQSFGETTDLGGVLGGVGRIGFWLPLNFSVEAEGSTSSSESIGVMTGTASLLYNVLLGSKSWGYAKAGVGGTRYGGTGDDCQQAKFVGRICGTTTTLVTGVGVRIGLTPTLMVRAEGAIYPNSGTTEVPGPTPADPPVKEDVKFTNYGVNVGLSFMLGSKPLPDSDGDGVQNNRDRCANTPPGAQVDPTGCPVDSDSDGVANGVDRCPNTPLGATVDTGGCPRDTDGDNIADGVDKCPETNAGALVDPSGCARDSDGDTIADGLDRCSATPQGATVDALGCPGDEDSDGVLDGLDRCPRTPAGVTVNSNGCARGQPGRAPAEAPVDTAPPLPVQAPPVGPTFATPMVLEGVSFGSGSARLQSGS